MELNIFTKEQQQFIKDNYAEYDRADVLTRKINNAEDSKELPIDELKDAMKSYRDRILKEREPFLDYNSVYNGKKNKVLRKHGFEPDDFYDEETIEELIQVQREMRKEAEVFEADMITPKKEKSALESMFKEETTTKDNSNQMQYR